MEKPLDQKQQNSVQHVRNCDVEGHFKILDFRFLIYNILVVKIKIILYYFKLTLRTRKIARKKKNFFVNLANL